MIEDVANAKALRNIDSTGAYPIAASLVTWEPLPVDQGDAHAPLRCGVGRHGPGRASAYDGEII